MNYRITIDEKTIKSKPKSKAEIGAISNRLAKVRSLTIAQIIEYAVDPYGFTISPSIFDGTRKNENWTEQQLFMLDFDSGVTPETVFNTLAQYGLHANAIYYTFRHTPEHPRFRLIIASNEVITDFQTAKNIDHSWNL